MVLQGLLDRGDPCPSEFEKFIGSELAFSYITEAWFDIIACGGDAADLAACLGSGTPPVLDLLTSVHLGEGYLGDFTPWPLQEPVCLEGPPVHGSVGYGGGCADIAALLDLNACGGLSAADAAGGGGPNLVLLDRAEWSRMLRGCREAWGPKAFLRRAVYASGPNRLSLIGRLLLQHEAPPCSDCSTPAQTGPDDGGGSSFAPAPASCTRTAHPKCVQKHSPMTAASAAAVCMLLEAASQLRKNRVELHNFLRTALPDGEELARAVSLESVVASFEKSNSGSTDAQTQFSDHAKFEPKYDQPIPLFDVVGLGKHQAGDGNSTAAIQTNDEDSEILFPLESQPQVCEETNPQATISQASETVSACDSVQPPSLSVCGLVAWTSAAQGKVSIPTSMLEEDDLPTIGSDVAAGLLIEPPAETLGCCICFGSFPTSSLRHCGRPKCGQRAYCLDCLRKHAETVVADGLYAAPSVRCPSCNCRIGTKAWSPFVSTNVRKKYEENAKALLTYRCVACDETGSYLADAGQARDPFASLDREVRERIAEVWQRFFLAEAPVEDFLQVVLDEYACGHRVGGNPPLKLGKIFGATGNAMWISDMERRLAVQLAWMHRFPMQRTLCCGERFCFRCKVSNWHRNVTCQERLQSEKAKQAQGCPGCGVPTVRSEGCRKIMCVCGRIWEWSGGDDSSDEGTFDGSDDEEEVAEAQTAMNLLALNSSASEETVSTVVQVLVAARADVNQPDGDAPLPLLLAMQARHPAAVQALCEHGALVTTEVLDELKQISHTQSRHKIESALRAQASENTNTKYPLWVWVQEGKITAVEALLRNSAHEEIIEEDVLVALQRSHASDNDRKRMTSLIRDCAGDERFKQLEISAATRRLMAEFRQAMDEERDVDVAVVQEAVGAGADVNSKAEAVSGSPSGLTGLNLVAMNCQASEGSVTSSIEALLKAQADVNAANDEASTPLLAAIQHRNTAAVEALCKARAKFNSEILDEVKLLSESTRRCKVETCLRPIILDNSGRRLPLWVWIQEGAVQAVDALLSGNKFKKEQVDVDSFVALQRCHGDLENKRLIEEALKLHVGVEEFTKLQGEAATRRLLQELREAYDDERHVLADIVIDALAQGADANAQENLEGDFPGSSYGLTACQLLVTNTYVKADIMKSLVTALVDAKAEINTDLGESPLLSAVQGRCVAGVSALAAHAAKVTSDVLDEIHSISRTRTRNEIEDVLKNAISNDKSLRCPLWVWVQDGNATAVEALLRNTAHDEEIEVDVLVSLQRSRGGPEALKSIADQLRGYVGIQEFQRLDQAAATRRLLQELREAYTEERDPDLDIICDSLEHGANPSAREEDDDDEPIEFEGEESEEQDEEEDEEKEEEEDEEDGEEEADEEEERNDDESEADGTEDADD